MPRFDERDDSELDALTALVSHDAARIQWEMQLFGAPQSEPDYQSVAALRAALQLRGVLPPSK